MTSRKNENHALRQARERRGWTQADLAEKVGSTTLTVYRWERGQTLPTLFYRHRLVEILGSSFEELGFNDHHGNGATTHNGDAPERTPSSGALLPSFEPTHLIGRAELLAQIKHSLYAGHHSIAITGLPGVGKTTLALALANDGEVIDHFTAGILWASVGPRPQALALLHGWGRALGWSAEDLATFRDLAALGKALRATIHDRRMLLIMDDIWQVEDALALQIGGPNCAHLLTTRLPAVAHQLAYDGTVMIDELGDEDGFALLQHLAPASTATFPDDIRSLIRQAGGLPLALTLIGHHLRVQELSGQQRRIHALITRLRQSQVRLALARPIAPTNAPPYLEPGTPLSLEVAIGVSTQELSEGAWSLLCALAIFPPKPNSFSEEAAHAISGIEGIEKYVEYIDALVDAGLIETQPPDRYKLHQTIADFARLSADTALIIPRMAQYFAGFVQMYAGDLATIVSEETNIRLAFDNVLQQPLSIDLVSGFITFSQYLVTIGSHDRAIGYLNKAISQARQMGALTEEAHALFELGRIAHSRGEYSKGEELAQQCIDKAEKADDVRLAISCRYLLGSLARLRGDFASAERILNDAITLSRELNLNIHHLHLLTLGQVYLKQGAVDRAEPCYREGLALAKETGSSQDIEKFLQAIGVLAAQRGNLLEAQSAFLEALAIAQDLHMQESTCIMLVNLGGIATDTGDQTKAKIYLQDAATIARKYGFQERLCAILASSCEMAMRADNVSLAQEYLDEGLALARNINSPDKIAVMLLRAGQIMLKRQNFDDAAGYLEEGLDLTRKLHHKLLCRFLNAWGMLEFAKGNGQKAQATYQDALALAIQMEFVEVQADVLFNLAQLAISQDNVTTAKQYGGQSLILYEAMNFHRVPEVKLWLANLPNKDQNNA